MNFVATIIIFIWAVSVFFFLGKPLIHVAILVSMISGWLFLPPITLEVIGFPGYTKISGIHLTILIAILISDFRIFKNLKFSWFDLPTIIWCLCPFLSSISNHLGIYDGLSMAFSQTVIWGIPYLIGRLYFSSLLRLKDLAIAIFIGGLIYVPFCWLEIIIGPKLLNIVYGVAIDESKLFANSFRFNGWRPTIFMQHGLMVGLWMMAASLCGIWLWQTKTLSKLGKIPIKWLLMCLLVTFILVKSTGTYFLFILGLSILLIGNKFNTTVPGMILIILIISYLTAGINGMIASGFVQESLTNFVGENRAQSVSYRIYNEQIIVIRTRQKPILGWGGWGRAFDTQNIYGHPVVPDSLWILAYGNHGLVGLISLTSSFLIPVFYFNISKSYPPCMWAKPKISSYAVLAVIIFLYFIDCLLNAMINPIYSLIIGGLYGQMIEKKQ